MTWAPTADQILDLDGVRVRVDRFRYELCDPDLTPIGELHPDRDQSVPSIQNDTANNTSRRLSGLKLVSDEAADVNTLSDRLRVYMVLQNGTEYRIGTFLWADASDPERSWGAEHHAELVDFTYILDQETTQAFGWGRGATIVLVMLFLCGRAGFELADLYPFGPEASRGLAEPKSWEPGTHWLQMFTDLGDIVGFASPWFDRDGRMHFDQIPNPAFDAPTVPPYGPGTRIVADSVVPSNEMLAAPNDFGVFDSGTGLLRAGRYQLPASAPHSFANRGFRIGKTQSVQGLASQAQATLAARNLARSSDAYEYVTFSSTLDPRHDTYDIVPYRGSDGVLRNWLETSWKMDLRSGGTMQHTLKRVTYDVV